jgi:hypothetical protein
MSYVEFVEEVKAADCHGPMANAVGSWWTFNAILLDQAPSGVFNTKHEHDVKCRLKH